jgi:HEAT repeat protein
MRWLTACLVLTSLAYPALAGPKYGEREVADLVEIAQAEKQPEARRARAIRELEHTEIRTQLSLLRRLLREERSLDIRLSAACTLAALGDRKAPRDLLLVSAYDGSRTPNCSRSDVLLALARMGDPAAEMHFEKALREDAPPDEPFYYADVCRALGILNTPGARKLLLRSLREGSSSLRQAVITPLSPLAADPQAAERDEARLLILNAARADPDEKVAEQAASALLWCGVDGPGFFRMLGSDPDPKVRARAARVMDRHYLSPARLARLRAALARETDPDARGAMEKTLASQSPK